MHWGWPKRVPSTWLTHSKPPCFPSLSLQHIICSNLVAVHVQGKRSFGPCFARTGSGREAHSGSASDRRDLVTSNFCDFAICMQ